MVLIFYKNVVLKTVIDNKKAPLKANNNLRLVDFLGLKISTIKKPKTTLNMGNIIFNIKKT